MRLERWTLIVIQGLHAVVFLPLLLGQVTLTHDPIAWNFPVFSYFFEQLSHGAWPTFNYFSRFGEPFLLYAAQMRLFDPVSALLGIALWNVAPTEILAFNWFHYVLGSLQAWGVYFFLKKYTDSHFTLIFLVVSLLFGSFFIGSLRQDGFLNQFLWIPWIAILLRKWVSRGEIGWPLALSLGILVGSSFQSYFFVGTFLFCLVFSILLWANRPTSVIFKVWPSGLIFLLALLPMTALNIHLKFESKDWVFPARTLPTSIEYFYKFDRDRLNASRNDSETSLTSREVKLVTGATTRLWDFIQGFSPLGNINVSSKEGLFYGDPSEAYIYIGLAALILGFWGLGRVETSDDWTMLNMLAFFILISAGVESYFSTLLSYIFPSIELIRNSHCFTLFVHFFFYYFVMKGIDDVVKRMA